MKKITMKAVVESIPAVTEFVDGVLESIDCPMRALMQINVAIDEIFSNIAHYAYPGKEGEATVQVSFDEQKRTVTICFRDRGVPYNSLDKTDPDVSLPAVERAVGGLGIFLVKKLMDNITYEYADGMNILCITKNI